LNRRPMGRRFFFFLLFQAFSTFICRKGLFPHALQKRAECRAGKTCASRPKNSINQYKKQENRREENQQTRMAACFAANPSKSHADSPRKFLCYLYILWYNDQ